MASCWSIWSFFFGGDTDTRDGCNCEGHVLWHAVALRQRFQFRWLLLVEEATFVNAGVCLGSEADLKKKICDFCLALYFLRTCR